MIEQFKIGEEFQKVSKQSFDAAVHAYGEANKGFQAITAELATYFKKTFENATRAFEQLVGVKSKQSKFSLDTPRRHTTSTLPKCRSSVRCMSAWRAARTSPLRLP